jgi:hypothetical protein
MTPRAGGGTKTRNAAPSYCCTITLVPTGTRS